MQWPRKICPSPLARDLYRPPTKNQSFEKVLRLFETMTLRLQFFHSVFKKQKQDDEQGFDEKKKSPQLFLDSFAKQ